jgi:hypothetical protein
LEEPRNGHDDSDCLLSLVTEAIYVLRRQSLGAQVLFESDNKMDNLLIELLSPHSIRGLGETSVQEERETRVALILKPCILLNYRHLSTKRDADQVKKVRGCFAIEWFRCRHELILNLLQLMVNSTRLSSPSAGSLSQNPHFSLAFLWI